MLFKTFFSSGLLGCLFGFAAFVDLVNEDSPRRLPVEMHWIGIIPLAISLILVPFLLSKVTKRVETAGKLDRSVQEHFEKLRPARERAGIERTDPGVQEFDSEITKLQKILDSSIDESNNKMRAMLLKCVAAFGIALIVLLLRITTL